MLQVTGYKFGYTEIGAVENIVISIFYKQYSIPPLAPFFA